MRILYKTQDNLSFIVEDKEVIYNVFLKGYWDENFTEFTEKNEVWFDSISEGSIECSKKKTEEILKYVKENSDKPISLSEKLMN